MHTCMYIDKVIHLRSMMIFKLPCFQRDGIIYTHMYVMCILIDAPSTWLTHGPLVTVMSLLDYLPDLHPPKVVPPPPSPPPTLPTNSLPHFVHPFFRGDVSLARPTTDSFQYYTQGKKGLVTVDRFSYYHMSHAAQSNCRSNIQIHSGASVTHSAVCLHHSSPQQFYLPESNNCKLQVFPESQTLILLIAHPYLHICTNKIIKFAM